MKGVSIVIPSRTPALVERCIGSVEAQGSALEREYIVISNNRDMPADAYVSGPFNFSAMVNAGVDRAKHSFVVLLNDDVSALDEGWLEALSRHDVSGAVLLYPDGRIQHAGVVVGGGRGPVHIGMAERGSPSLWPWLTTTREVLAVTAACMGFRREVFDTLEGFDTSFPVNYNDVDFCLRAWKAGYRVVLEADAVLQHDESRTRGAGTTAEERKRFAERWPDVLGQPDPYYSEFLLHGTDRIRLKPV